MLILGLDLSERAAGFCKGEAGDKTPTVGVIKCRDSDELTAVAVARLAIWLRNNIEKSAPDLIVVEAYIPPGAMQGTTAAITEGAILLNGCVRGIAACYGIAVRAPTAAKVRKYFCGQSSAAPRRKVARTRAQKSQDREATKQMVLARAKLLGLISRDCTSNDMADAAALWAFGCAYWGGARDDLMLFKN